LSFQRFSNPTYARVPARSTASQIAAASSLVVANGFSSNRSRPADAQAIDASRWAKSGVAMIAAVASGWAASASCTSA
jgi:hypothetical protein